MPTFRLFNCTRGPVWGLLVAACWLAVGCASQGPERSPLATTTAAKVGLQAVETPAVVAQWWQGLGDAQLSQLVERALQDQPSLASARARLEQAQAITDSTRTMADPHLALSADASRQRYSAHGLMPPPIAGATWNSANVQVGLSWSPDWWSQHAIELAAALGQVRAAQADAAFASQALAGQVSRSYIALAKLLAQQEVLEQMHTQRQQLLQLTQQRVAAGLDTEAEATQARTAVAEVQAQQEALQEQVTLARRQVAVLCGQAPDAQQSLSPSLEALQLEPLPATLGADLLGRRADVVAARWRVEAAAQSVALARTEFYPDVHLGAFIGLNALGLNHLLSAGSRQMGVAPALRLPLFDGKRLRAQLGSRQAELDVAIAQYNSTVLEAVKQAGDALASVQSLLRQAQAQTQAQAQAQASHHLAQQRYRAGLSHALAVLQSETPVWSQRRLAIEVRARQLDTQVVLMQALGGGWLDGSPVIAAEEPTTASRKNPT